MLADLFLGFAKKNLGHSKNLLLPKPLSLGSLYPPPEGAQNVGKLILSIPSVLNGLEVDYPPSPFSFSHKALGPLPIRPLYNGFHLALFHTLVVVFLLTAL